MEYSILALRAPEEEDGRLYPVLSDGHTIAAESLDGEPLRLLASGLAVSERVAGGSRTHLRMGNTKAEVLIGDARLAVKCMEVGRGARKGIGAGGGRGRDDNMLVGHVRYPWLRCVGFKPRARWRSSEEVRLGVLVKAPDGVTRELFLDLRFPKGVDSAAVARATVARAARYHLAHGGKTGDAARTSFEQLATDGPRVVHPSPGKFLLYQLPCFSFVSATSAYPAPNARAETGR